MTSAVTTDPRLPVQAPDDLVGGSYELLRDHPARYYFHHRALILPAGLTEVEQRRELTLLFGEATEDLMAKVREGLAVEAAKR